MHTTTHHTRTPHIPHTPYTTHTTNTQHTHPTHTPRVTHMNTPHTTHATATCVCSIHTASGWGGKNLAQGCPWPRCVFCGMCMDPYSQIHRGQPGNLPGECSPVIFGTGAKATQWGKHGLLHRGHWETGMPKCRSATLDPSLPIQKLTPNRSTAWT